MAGRSTLPEPLVSILTPSYNQGRFLPDCLRSVRDQSYSKVEHIVMDGASSDGSVDVLQQAGDSIRWESRPDNGQSDALNRAFDASAGEIIGWLNSDDAYFRPTVIDQVVETFARRPDVDVVYGHAAMVNADGLLLQLIWVPPFSAALFRWENFIIQPTAFVRRSALGGTFVDESFDYAMDRELWLRLASTCKFARLPRVLAIDRHHGARKGETMGRVLKVESVRLRDQYRLPRASGSSAFKLWRIAKRAWALSLVPGARKGPFAFSVKLDGVARLVVRQVATPRRWMPAGS
jgi:glycosyltransferase involved in cell wall biosynthesis